MASHEESASRKRRRNSDAKSSPFFVESSADTVKKAKITEETGDGVALPSSPSAVPTGNNNELNDAKDNLEALLDLSGIENQSQMQERFDKVAEALLCDYYLVVDPDKDGGSTKVEIMELEFYVQKEGFHEDPFTHGSEEQRVAGRW
jgi:hypothetical protein